MIKSKNLKLYLPLTIFIVIAVFLALGLRNNPYDVDSPLIGKALPKISAQSLQNPQQLITNQDFLGRVTILSVFASWCHTCQYEHPFWMDIKHKQTVTMIGLNYKDDRETALDFLNQVGNPYSKVIYDPRGKLGIDLGIYGIPETFVIDPKGIIRYKYVGAMTPDIWQSQVLPILNKFKNK